MHYASAPGGHWPGRESAKGGLRRGERGACGLKAVLWLVIMVCFIFVAIKAVPVFLNEYQFQDAMQTIARFASVNRQSENDIRLALLKEASKDDIPIRPEDIRVTNNNGNVRIEAVYSVTLDGTVVNKE